MAQRNWTVPKDWKGKTVICVGAGPSLTPEVIKVLTALPTDKFAIIACKDAAAALPDADCMIFLDRNMIDDKAKRAILDAFKGDIITTSGRAYNLLKGRAKLIDVVQNEGLSRDPKGIASGGNTGYAALNLAFLRGATRIVLVAYDMRNVPATEVAGKDAPPPAADAPAATHFNRTDGPATADDYAGYLAAFETIAKELEAAKVEVINATPGSDLKAFKSGDLATVLSTKEKKAAPQKETAK